MAIDYYMKIDGVKGESETEAHKDEIKIISYSVGATQPGTFGDGSGGTAGKVSWSDFSFTMETQSATIELIKLASSGKHIEKGAVLSCDTSTGEGGQQTFLTIELKPLIVSSVHHGGSQGNDRSVDSVSLNYGTIRMEYKKQADQQGTLQSTGSVTHDLIKNKTS